MACELRPLKRCDGSARFNFERTSVMAGIHGPMEAKTAQKLSEESILIVNHASGEVRPCGGFFHASSATEDNIFLAHIMIMNPRGRPLQIRP
jgi:hypothetical protein